MQTSCKNVRKTGSQSLFNLVTLLVAIFSLCIPAAPVSAIVPCPLPAQTGRTVVSFDGSILVSEGAEGTHQTSVTLSTPIPAGNYDITLASYDGHGQDSGNELYEQWYVIVHNSKGAPLAFSESIADLPNGQFSLTQIVNTDFGFFDPVTSVTAAHTTTYDSSPNSIIPVCVAFDSKDSVPQINTNVATLITRNSATLSGYVSSAEPTDTAHWFEWGLSPLLGQKTQEITSRGGPRTISVNISGLEKDTVYYFRAAARNYAGTSSGSMLRFSTQAGPQYAPFVATLSASNISGTSATLNGNEIKDNSSDTVHWFKWGETDSLEFKTPEVTHDPARLTFFENISGLNSGTKYYVKAFARNSVGTTEGGLLNFKAGPFLAPPYPSPLPVPSSSPVVSPVAPVAPTTFTKSPTAITENTVIFNGLAIADIGVSTNAWFEWGTKPSLGNETNHKTLGQISYTDFSDSVTGLASNTFYYYRAAVENARGKSYGTTFLFRTSPRQGEAPAAPPSASLFASARTRVSGQGLIALTMTSSSDTVRIGTPVRFTVSAENKSKKLLTNVLLTVTLPQELLYRQMTTSVVGMEKKTSVVNQTISFPLGDLIAGDKATFVVEATVKDDTVDKKIFTTVAEIMYVDPATNIEGEETVFAITTAAEASAGFAALLFAGGFLTWFLFGLLGLLFVILLFMWLRRGRKEEKKK